MRVSRRRNTAGPRRQHRHKRWLRSVLWTACGLLAALAVVNVGMWVAYRDRVPPNYHLGVLPVGGLSRASISEHVANNPLLPEVITIQAQDDTYEIATEVLGVQPDVQQSAQALASSRTPVPLLALFVSTTIPVVLDIDEVAFSATVTPRVAQTVFKEPLPERIAFDGETFVVAEAEGGYAADTVSLENGLINALGYGRTAITITVTELEAPASTANLAPQLEHLRAQLATDITYVHGTHRAQPTARDIGQWFVRDGQSMRPEGERIGRYIQEAAEHSGITPHNTRDAVAATQYALESGNPVDFVLTAESASVMYTYCTAVRGIGGEHLAAFTDQSAAILGDPRGWNAGGLLSFVRADDDCDFTLWLSAREEVPGFGWPCDTEWSCRVGRNVIINYDRWHGATDSWNEAGESLTDYRALVVNHEVGHWLGFGHLSCTGDGDPAPVMMQQSIEMNGCEFNPWPVESELDVVKQDRGIAALPPRETELLAHDSCCCAHCASLHS